MGGLSNSRLGYILFALGWFGLAEITSALLLSGAADAGAVCNNQDEGDSQNAAKCHRVIETKDADHENFNASMARGRVALAQNGYQQAVAEFSIAINLFPDLAEPYGLRGVAFDRTGDLDRALSDYSTAIRLDPADPSTYRNRALGYLKKGAYDFAITDFDEAIRVDPTSSVAHNGRGVALSKIRRYERAVAAFSEAIRLNARYANAYNNRGIAYTDLRQFDLAIADLKQAIHLDPSNPNFYNELAWTHVRAGRFAEGLHAVDHALWLRPDYSTAYDTRGSIYEALGQNAKAIADFKMALSHDPRLTNSAEAIRRLSGNTVTAASFANVVEFVEKQGRRMDLGQLCVAFGLQREDNQCVFKQVGVQEIEGQDDPHGFNVPAHPRKQEVLLFHLGPLVGEFFIVSAQGELIRAYYRTKGRGYSRIPNDEVLDRFKLERSYWIENFDRLR